MYWALSAPQKHFVDKEWALQSIKWGFMVAWEVMTVPTGCAATVSASRGIVYLMKYSDTKRMMVQLFMIWLVSAVHTLHIVLSANTSVRAVNLHKTIIGKAETSNYFGDNPSYNT